MLKLLMRYKNEILMLQSNHIKHINNIKYLMCHLIENRKREDKQNQENENTFILQLLQSRVNETTTHHSKHMMIDYFRLSNDPSVTSVSLFLIDAPNLICRTLNRQSAGRFDRANCFDRLPLPGYSSPSKIASLTPRSFDYFSPVCNGVLPLTTEPKRRKKTGQRDRTTKRKKRTAPK